MILTVFPEPEPPPFSPSADAVGVVTVTVLVSPPPPQALKRAAATAAAAIGVRSRVGDMAGLSFVDDWPRGARIEGGPPISTGPPAAGAAPRRARCRPGSPAGPRSRGSAGSSG